MNDDTRVVIIGWGFAGTAMALNLEKRYRHDPSVEITLIDAENFFFVRGAKKFYPNVSPEEVRMVLIHSRNRILPVHRTPRHNAN